MSQNFDDDTPPALTPIDRLALLARAAVEAQRFAAPHRAAAEEAWQTAIQPYAPKQRRAAVRDAEPYFVTSGPVARRVSSKAAAAAESELEAALRQKAELELALRKESELRREVEQKSESQRVELFEARESLALQQRKIKELHDDRSKLLESTSELESVARRQVNETEQVRLEFEKLKAKRQAMGDLAADHVEKIQHLEAEVARLKAELEASRQTRDRDVSVAQTKVESAEALTEDAALRELWLKMHKVLPEVFVDTHIPTRRTFEHLCESYCDLLEAAAVVERHVHSLLKDLRQVGEQSDKLNHFYIMFTKNPGLVETLREFLATGKRKSNYVNLLRAQQTWSRAFATGLYKVIVRVPVTIGEELNPRQWPIKTSVMTTEETAIGKYYKETAVKEIPEKLGTKLRKQAGDMAYEDYDDLMKRR